MEAAENFQDFEVHRGEAGFGNGVIRKAKDGFVHLFVDFGDDFLDAAGMNAAIEDEALHGFARDLAAVGIEAGEQDGSGRIINQDGDASGSFESANVAAFAANVAPFDFVALESDGGSRVFEAATGVTVLIDD